MSKPRIVVVSPFIDKRHGTERSVAECIQRLSSDYDIHVYSNRVEDLNPEAITWHRIPRLPGPHLVSYIWWFAANHLWRWRDRTFLGLVPEVVFSPGINCLDADVIHVHVVFAQLRERMRKQLLFRQNPTRTYHEIVHRRIYYALIAFLERRIYPRQTVRLVAISRKSAGDLAHFYGRAKNVQIVHNGLDLDRFRPSRRAALRSEARQQLRLGASDFALLLIGNDWKSKGLPCILEAVGRLNDPHHVVLVVGNDNPAPFQNVIASHRLAERVHFLPTRSDVEFYYAAADVYASPTLEDAFALPPAEAMACGLPIITSTNNGGAEIVCSGKNGFVLRDPSDSESVAKILFELKNDPELYERISTAAVETASKLTWDDAAEHLRAAWEAARAEKTGDSKK